MVEPREDRPRVFDGPVLISIIVVTGFFAILILWLVTKASSTPPSEGLSIMLGAMASAFTTVVGYWMGSSAGSKDKDASIRAAMYGGRDDRPGGQREFDNDHNPDRARP